MFCGIRRVENRDILFSLSKQRQRDIILSDRTILLDGWVADIDVYCNNPEALQNSIYNSQLLMYYNEKMEFCRIVNEKIGNLAMNGKLSYNLERMYARCRNALMGMEYYKDKQFSNTILRVTALQPLIMDGGDKLADRYGETILSA